MIKNLLLNATFHCYHDAAGPDGVPRFYFDPFFPSTKDDKLVCCWCGVERLKFSAVIPYGHGPFSPLTLQVDLKGDEECPKRKKP